MQLFKNQVNLMVRFLFSVQRGSGLSGFSCSRKTTFKKRFDLWNSQAELPTLKACPLAVRVQSLPEVSQVTVPSFCEECCTSIQEPQHMQTWCKCGANLQQGGIIPPTAGIKKVQQSVPRKAQVKITQKRQRQTWKLSTVYSNLETVAILLTFLQNHK